MEEDTMFERSWTEIDGDYPQKCNHIIRQFADEFDITGIFTHLCVADSPDKEDISKRVPRKFTS